jgi:hypothetical protein
MKVKRYSNFRRKKIKNQKLLTKISRTIFTFSFKIKILTLKANKEE